MSALTGCCRYRFSIFIHIVTLTSAGAASAQVTAPQKYTAFDLAPGEGIHIIDLQATSRITSGDIFLNGSATSCKASRKDPGSPSTPAPSAAPSMPASVPPASPALSVPPGSKPAPAPAPASAPAMPAPAKPSELAQLVVAYGADCPLFTQSTPSKFSVIPVPPKIDCSKDESNVTSDCTRSITVEFDAGEPISGTYAGQLWMSTNVFKVTPSPMDVCAARWTPKGWQLDNLQLILDGARVRTVGEIADLPRQGTLYLRVDRCEQARQNNVRPVVVNYTIEQKTSGATFPSDAGRAYDRTYVPVPPLPSIDTYKKASIAWVLYIDQANEKGVPRITYNPNNYVLTNSFGRVRVRHWRNVTPALTTSGSGTALTTATLEGGVAASGATPLITGSLLATDGEALVTEFLVPPHAPGTMHVLVKFTDVDDPTKVREAGTDIIVDRSYSSALRFGVAHIFGLHDIQYKGIQYEKEGRFVITKRSSELNEIVLGYALYFDWLFSHGRSYNLTCPLWVCPAQYLGRHVGLYAGFGAVSFASGNFDYLKSFHFGLEFEIKNFSLAVTMVTRRTPSLNGSLHVGDEVLSADIDTVDRYRFGFGVVANFSTDFLRFTAGGVK